MKTKKELQTRAGELLVEIDAIRSKEDGQVTDEERVAATDKIAKLKEINVAISEMETLEEQRKLVEAIPDETKKDERSVITDVEDRAVEKPWASMGEYIQAVCQRFAPAGDRTVNGMPAGVTDKRLLKTNREERTAFTGLNESVPADGGFLVQTDYSKMLLQNIIDTGLLVPRTERFTISSNANSLKIPGVDETSRVDGARAGGVQAYWTNEEGQKTKSQPKLREVTLNLNKLTGLVRLTDEIIQDASVLQQLVISQFQREFGFKVDAGIFSGTGAGQPLGFQNSPALVVVPAEAGQIAGTIVYENIINMYARVAGITVSRSNLVFLTNQQAIPQLMTMSIAVGTGGVPVWIPANSAANQPFDTLMGIPILYIEQAEALGTQGDISLVNLKEYVTADKGGIQQASSIHLRFDYDQTVLRFVWRFDGQPKWAKALTPYKGAPTVSPYVTLAARP